ncbi:MAG: DUF1275 domain-containing protein [Bdellovibrionaceae bacterium]|nr:DUF1275 domain-containing protein [Pseudobdellovibrionaceae bacterium]MBX3032979.1 DUF1275 domain-containing protein [Pseudobdellovibrionaceae bacterium]
MFSHHFDEKIGKRVIFHWFMLSFSGGCINAGGFLATGKFVSHVTGFATLFGVDVASNQIENALSILSVPLFFLLGAFAAGLLIDRPLHQGRTPHVDWVMGLSALCLFLAAGGGEMLWFGKFSGVVGLEETYALLAVVCLASGLQNGAITSSSGRSVRTTHLTGLTTDLGLGLARALTFDLKKSLSQKEARANFLRIGSILSFVFGSAVGAWVFLAMGYKGFLLPALISVYAAWHGRKAKVVPRDLPLP